MDNDDAKALLLNIRRECLEHYPFTPGDTVDLRYCSAFGFIAGIITEALQAKAQDRPMRINLAQLPTGEET